MSKSILRRTTIPLDEPERLAVLALHEIVPGDKYPTIKAACLAVAEANVKGLPGLDAMGGFIVAYHVFQNEMESKQWMTLMAFLHRVEAGLCEAGPTLRAGV